MPTLSDLFRAELKRLLASGTTERRLAGEVLKSSQGKLQGWLREDKPTRPPMDALRDLAVGLGEPLPVLVARLCGEDAPGSDRTWAEVAEALATDPAALDALAAALDCDQLVDLSSKLLAVYMDRLRQADQRIY